jgi:hypothetical protein
MSRKLSTPPAVLASASNPQDLPQMLENLQHLLSSVGPIPP